jgi:hypothetical protein
MKFDFNKIKLKSSDEPNLTKKLTGDVVSELKPIGRGVQPNAELEGNEYLQFPDGKIQKVEGRSHKKSGVKMNIPDGTKILSNKLKLSSSDVKKVKDQFDIKLNANTTFAKAQERIDKKLGVKELNEEQEKQIKELEKQLEKGDIDEGTFRINQEYLSKQIYDSEKGKNEKQAMRSMLFNFIFELQEGGKSDSKKEKAGQGNFMYGGVKGATQKFDFGGIKVYSDGGDPPYQIKPGTYKMFQDVYDRGLVDLGLNIDEAMKRYMSIPDEKMRTRVMTAYKKGRNDIQCKDGKCQYMDAPSFKEADWNEFMSGYGTTKSVPDTDAIDPHAPTYVEAYEKVDKDKYPTIESFVADAEYYKEHGKNMPANELENLIKKSDTTETGIDRLEPIPLKEIQLLSTTQPTIQQFSETQGGASENLVEARRWDSGEKKWVTTMVPEGSQAHTDTLKREVWAKKSLKKDEDLVWNEELEKYEKVKVKDKKRPKFRKFKGRYRFEDGGEFKNGGLSDAQFAKLCHKFGISKEQGMEMLNSRLDRFDKGGGKDGDDPKWMFHPGYKGKTRFSELPREHQSVSDTAFGAITKDNIQQVMESLYRNFPDIVRDPDVFGVKFDENGDIKWSESLSFSQVSENVKEFQKRADKRMRESADVIINNPEVFSPEQVESARSFKEKETFLEDPSTVRDFDAKLGQFTSGRYNIGMDIVTPDELKILQEKNINTVSDLKRELEENPSLIGEDSKKRLETLSGLMTENSDFALSSFTPGKVTPTRDDITLPRRRRSPLGIMLPDIAPLPPSGLQAMYAPQSRFAFADPTRIGIKEEIQTTGDMMRIMGDKIMELPPQQRAIVMAQFQAERNQQLNEAAQKVNVINAQNLASTELFNVGQLGRMYQADDTNKLGFEQNQLTAQALTEEGWKNYYDDAIKRAMHRYGVKSALGLLSTMTPDVSLDADMAGVSYDPSEEWGIQDAGNFVKLFGNPFV